MDKKTYFYSFSFRRGKQNAPAVVYTAYMIAIILFQINCIPVLCENHRYLLNQKDGKSQRIPIVFLIRPA